MIMSSQQTETKPSKKQESIAMVNNLMKKLVPELDSEYAVFPLALERWNSPQEVSEDGDLCFIPSSEEEQGDDMPEQLQDYIWMPERKCLSGLPAGYYHLSTREAYIEVYSRLTQVSKKSSDLQTKKDRQLYCKITEVIENRLMCDVPDDVQAARMRVLNMQHHMAGGHGLSSSSSSTNNRKSAYLSTLTAVALSAH